MSAIVQFAGSFVFSPEAWLGVILVGISALLFLVSGGIPLVGWRKRRQKAKARKDSDRADHGGQPPAASAARRSQAAPSR